MDAGARTSVMFEDAQGGDAPSRPLGDHDYRIVSTLKTSTMEQEIQAAAAEGFRAIDVGFMTVVMEREPGAKAAPTDYRVLAMIRTSTAELELQEAGAEGFRLALAPEAKNQGVFVLQRTPGTSERFDYQIAQLTEKNANEVLTRAEADGYRVAVLLSDLVVWSGRWPGSRSWVREGLEHPASQHGAAVVRRGTSGANRSQAKPRREM